MNLDEALYRFYAERLMRVEPDLRAGSTVHPHQENLSGGQDSPVGISSVPELIDFVRHQQSTNPKFLFLREQDLRAAEDEAHDAASFPEALPIDNRVLPLTYAYQPGRHDDGVTVRVTLAEAEGLTPAALDWAVPGHLPEKVELMIKALPKEQRRSLIPLAETAQRLVRELALIAGRPTPPTLAEALAELLQPRLGVRIDPAQWSARALPDHLRVRVEVIDARDRVLCASRELGEIQALLRDRRREFSQQAATAENAAWRAARARWEGAPADGWKFGDLPGSVVVEEKHGVPVLAHPGLKPLAAGVAVRLFATPEEAAAATQPAVAQLLETQLRYDLAWLEKDLRALRMLGALTATLAPVEQLQADALECIRRWVCRREVQPLQAAVFAGVLARAKQDVRSAVPKLTDWLKEILEVRLELQTHAQPYPRMADDLAALLPPDFLRRTPLERLRHVPRYLRGMKLRADRWKRDTSKDAQRAAELAPFVAAAARPELAGSEFRWLIEEFRVSLFAQELGTEAPVSAVRLRRAWEDLAPGSAKVIVAPAAAPVVVAPAATRKSTPLKSLGALDQLFRK
jgi:ATP-dependent helicase HrpA